MSADNISKNLINWYHKNSRDLPWRKTTDPYKIWLSEIILQQTRVSQGLPYYLNFSKKFPTVKTLANASESTVLREWQGLGYYSRARNLHKCAKLIVEEYDCKFPNSYEGLLKLPGIGPYTAAAIASFAFKEPVPAIDGNALRVYTRLLGISDDIGKQSTITSIRERAKDIIPGDEPNHFNQGVMELGSRICTPKNPQCEVCPLNSACFAYSNKVQVELPVKVKKVKIKNRYFNYFVLKRGSSIALFERKKNDIWKGLYDFYLLESSQLLDPVEVSEPYIVDYLQNGGQIDLLGEDIKHILSHQVIFARFFEITLPENLLREEPSESPALNFYSKKEVLDLPKPVLVNNFLNYYFSILENNSVR